MPSYSRVVSIYERLIVLSNSSITREIHAMLSPSALAAPPVLRDVCALLVKSGEWRRALVVAHALPDAAGKQLVASLGLTKTSKDSNFPAPPLSSSPVAKVAEKSEDEKTAAALREAPVEELLRLAFALQRRPAFSSGGKAHATDKEADALYATQRRLFFEFQRRRCYKELAQCVASWHAKALLPPRDASRAENANVRFHAEDALRDLFFGPAPRCDAWDEALHSCPDIFFRVLRDPSAAVRFVRKAGPETAVQFVAQLMRTAPTEWDAVAALCIALEPHLSDETVAAKADILRTFVKAVQRESVRNKSPTIRAAAESLCATFTRRYEAHARFIGLQLFTEVAIALCDCGAGVPDALLQCILLCIGDARRVESTEINTRTRGSAFAPEREYFSSLALQLPEERWVNALRIIQAWSAQENAVVAPAHLRCLLSGMQSISIPRTWLTALHTAQCMMNEYKIQPDEPTVHRIMLNLRASSWERAFEVLHLYEQKRVAPPPSILRDLHVVAMKHAPFDVVLRLMEAIKACGEQHVHFMNHLYCLRAYGCAGKWNEAAVLFQQLKNVPDLLDESAYNEVTVAVPVVGMMEKQYWPEIRRFLETVCGACGEEITQQGWLVVLAAELLRMVHMDDISGTALFLNRYAGRDEGEENQEAMMELSQRNRERNCALMDDPPFPVAKLGFIVAKATELQTLLGMESLNAPIRLIFDVLAVDVHRHPGTEQIGSVSRGNTAKVRLYIPQRHVRQQREWFAVAMGKMVRREESQFSAAAQRTVARVLTKLGVGPEYMKAALL